MWWAAVSNGVLPDMATRWRRYAQRTGMHWWWLSVLVVLLDRASKLFFEGLLGGGSVMHVFPGLNFALAYNTGAAFSFLRDAGGWQRWFFIALSLFIGVVLLRWLLRVEARRVALGVPLTLVLGGALGNLVDRISSGRVVDFIDVYYRHWHWPTFNVADSAISVGVVLLLIDSWRTPRPMD